MRQDSSGEGFNLGEKRWLESQRRPGHRGGFNPGANASINHHWSLLLHPRKDIKAWGVFF